MSEVCSVVSGDLNSASQEKALKQNGSLRITNTAKQSSEKTFQTPLFTVTSEKLISENLRELTSSQADFHARMCPAPIQKVKASQESEAGCGHITQKLLGKYDQNTQSLKTPQCSLFSPPYEKTVKDHGKSDRATKINVEKNNYSSFAHSGDESNIGNQKKETYLEAMKTVYAECHKVLKPQGLLILILKNFIRDKKVVPLTDHTIKLCESVGFKLRERLLFKLPTHSFWRRLYSQKYPKVDTADLQFEHILVFEKEGF